MKNTPFDLTGKVAVVTGSSRGIGRSSAELLARLGAKVVISSRKADACHEVAEGIKSAGGDAHVIPCNISHKEEVQALVQGAVNEWGRIDTLVCNAAVNPYFGPLAGIGDEAFDKIMAANVKSNLWLCNLAIPEMVKTGGGSVVIVSSIAGLRGNAMLGAYGISKAADFGLTRNLAVAEQRGWVSLRTDPADARSRLAAITPKGSRTLVAAMPIWNATQQRLLQDIGESAAASLHRLAGGPCVMPLPTQSG